MTHPLSLYRWKFLIVNKSISINQSTCKMPRKFFSIHHVAYEISPTLDRLSFTEISLPYRLKRNFAISWPKFALVFFGTVLYLDLSVRRETYLPLILFSCSSHFQRGWYIAQSQSSKEYFRILFRCSKNHLPNECVHGFIRYCPSYCRAFTTKLMGLPVAKLEARKERSSLQPKHLDRQYLQDKQVLLDQFRKNRSTNSGTQFGIDFCFSLFSYKVTCFAQRVWDVRCVYVSYYWNWKRQLPTWKQKQLWPLHAFHFFIGCYVLLRWKLDCYDTMEKTQKNKYLKNLKIWNMGPQDLTSFVAYLPGFYNYFGLSDCLYLTCLKYEFLVAAEAQSSKV